MFHFPMSNHQEQVCLTCSDYNYLPRQRNRAKYNLIVKTGFQSLRKNVFQTNGSISVLPYKTADLLCIPAVYDQSDNPVMHKDPLTIYLLNSFLSNLIFLRLMFAPNRQRSVLVLMKEQELLSQKIS